MRRPHRDPGEGRAGGSTPGLLSLEDGMGLQMAERWLQIEKLTDGIPRIWEPHVIRVAQCNIWHVRGRDRDLIIDTGMGMASLSDAARHLFDKPLSAVATHTHYDHVGSLHEFADRIVHEDEAECL